MILTPRLQRSRNLLQLWEVGILHEGALQAHSSLPRLPQMSLSGIHLEIFADLPRDWHFRDDKDVKGVLAKVKGNSQMHRNNPK